MAEPTSHFVIVCVFISFGCRCKQELRLLNFELNLSFYC